jgi:hypothetical protein
VKRPNLLCSRIRTRKTQHYYFKARVIILALNGGRVMAGFGEVDESKNLALGWLLVLEKYKWTGRGIFRG